MSGQNECGNCVLVENRFWHVDYCNECEYCLNIGICQGSDDSFTEQDLVFFDGIDLSLSQEEAEGDRYRAKTRPNSTPRKYGQLKNSSRIVSVLAKQMLVLRIDEAP